MADNFHFDITSDKREHFDLAFDIGFTSRGTGQAYTYKIDPNKGMILSSNVGEENSYIKLPYPMNKQASKSFVWGWLESVTMSDFSKYPSHDGTNKKGFRIYNEAWNKVDNSYFSFMAIKPTWLMYGK